MKDNHIIPVEILSIKDKILAGLNFLQIFLLSFPGGISLLLIFLPQAGRFNLLKLIILITAWLVFTPLAIKVDGRLVLNWLLLRCRYNHRPLAYKRDKG